MTSENGWCRLSLLTLAIPAALAGCTAPTGLDDALEAVGPEALLGRYAYTVADPCGRTEIVPGMPPTVLCVGASTVFAGGLALTETSGDSVRGHYSDPRGVFPARGVVQEGQLSLVIDGPVLRQETRGIIGTDAVTGEVNVWYSWTRQRQFPFRMVRVQLEPAGSS